jgi:hypothetical protein
VLSKNIFLSSFFTNVKKKMLEAIAAFTQDALKLKRQQLDFQVFSVINENSLYLAPLIFLFQ